MAKPTDKIKKINAKRDKKAPNIRKKISGPPRKKTLKNKNALLMGKWQPFASNLKCCQALAFP